MKVLSLFSGCGGLDLGLAQAGLETDLLCENNPDAQQLLRWRFPSVPIAPDVSTLGVRDVPDGIGLLAAGFPCKDISQAGRTLGVFGKQSGLVSEVFRLLQEVRPDWCLVENVQNMLYLHGGEALNLIVTALERLGYSWAYRLVDSRSFGLPQRRHRVFLLASLTHDPSVRLLGQSVVPDVQDRGLDPDATCYGFYWTEGKRGLGWTRNAVPTLRAGSTVGVPSPPAIWLVHKDPREAFVTPSVDDADTLQGFPRGWTAGGEGRKWVGARWLMIGNAVSSPVGAWLGMRIHTSNPGTRLLAIPWGKETSWPQAAWGYPDGTRFASPATTWPLRLPMMRLEDLLVTPSPLSLRAAHGHLKRLRTGTVRPQPEFLSALENYCR